MSSRAVSGETSEEKADQLFFRRIVIGHDAERGSFQGEGVVWESKTHERPPSGVWMDIQIPSVYNPPCLVAPKFFGMAIDRKFLKRLIKLKKVRGRS